MSYPPSTPFSPHRCSGPVSGPLTPQKNPWRAIAGILIALVATVGTWLGSAAPAIATGVYEMPPLEADTLVIDEAKLFSRINKGNLERGLRDIADDTGVTVRFVTFRRLDYGETIDSFNDELFETWYPDAETQANQILMSLDVVTNNSAIRVGSEVNDRLPAAIATSIAQETLQVPIRDGNYNEAFLDAKDRLAAVLSGQEDPGPPVVESKISVESTYKKAEETDRGGATIIVVVLLILATAIPMVTYYAYQR